jgi:hypothetical protein
MHFYIKKILAKSTHFYIKKILVKSQKVRIFILEKYWQKVKKSKSTHFYI